MTGKQRITIIGRVGTYQTAVTIIERVTSARMSDHYGRGYYKVAQTVAGVAPECSHTIEVDADVVESWKLV